ncbi:hypothetical protein EON63_02840 [archaeon]|nr:MAG: hypothetical protein EON63_02840 [archaeon]
MLDGVLNSLDEARYEHTILDSRLQPLQSLPIPSAEVLEDYAHDLSISPITVCSDPLGFYQVY